jgi:RecA-family ATPase
MGPRVLINGIWYYTLVREVKAEPKGSKPDAKASPEPDKGKQHNDPDATVEFVIKPKAEPEPEPFHFIDIAAWEGKPVPPRDWLVSDFIPAGPVAAIYGDGGTGKSILLLMLAVCVALGRDWLGAKVPVTGPVVILCCEDDEKELHRRMDAVTRLYNTSYRELAPHLHLRSFDGEEALLAAYDSETGGLNETELLLQLKEATQGIRPRLIGIDNVVDVFGGNEIIRLQARQFVRMMRKLAKSSDSTVVLTAHPSQTGMNTGAGTSGSTGWSNAFRSRMYFTRVREKNEEGEELDPNLRKLEVMKANYGPIGATIQLRYHDGVFVPVEDAVSTAERQVHESEVDARFLQLLDEFTESGRVVSPHQKATSNYAPTRFAAAAGTPRYSKNVYEASMERLFTQKKIRVEPYGRPSNPHIKLVRK